MKIKKPVLWIFAALLLIPCLTLESGPRGGGGRGGRGGGRAAVNRSAPMRLDRTPSMSNVRVPANRQIRNNNINQIRNNNINRNGQRMDRNAFSQIQQNHRQLANQVQARVRTNQPLRRDWFNTGFYQNHRFHPNYNFRGNWGWRGAPWYGVSSWLGWGGAYPYYYDDGGSPIEITMDDSNNEPIQNQEDYQGDWIPLGVFVAGKNATDATYSNFYLQLAINKAGSIAGTYYNAATDKTHPIAGNVDRYSQQVTLRLSDRPDAPVMMTGLYNLTQDVAPVQMQFADGTNESWVLVRVNDNDN